MLYVERTLSREHEDPYQLTRRTGYSRSRYLYNNIGRANPSQYIVNLELKPIAIDGLVVIVESPTIQLGA